MTSQRGEVVAVAVGLTYLVALAWSMSNTSYDIWGALLVTPVYGVIGVLGLRWLFRGELQPVATVMCWGLLIKLAGTFARYWVGFEAYGGGIDASAYHARARVAAGQVWSGEISVLDLFGADYGTVFVDSFTSLTYVLTGSSQLAGFITFSFLAYSGLALFVKAAAIAVPSLAVRKYAWVCVVFPSLVYWPSSIGKEALMMLGLGAGTLGIAILLAHHRWFASLLLTTIGLGFAGYVRPHIAGIWIAAAVPALVLAFLVGSRASSTFGERKTVNRLGLLVVLIIAAIGLSVAGSITVRFLGPGHEETATPSFTEILEETSRRTSKVGSTFDPPPVGSPTAWPFAVARTLTRPLPIEARGLAQLVSAAEIMALFGLYTVSWRRVANLPRMLLTNPYVAFAMTTLFLGGLAYSSFANLGVLTRQKSLLMPFLLLPACLPVWVSRKRRVTGDAPVEMASRSAQNRSMSPSESAQLASGGNPLSLTARHVRTGRPPGSGTNFDDIWD